MSHLISSESEQASQRLFFALWPSAAQAEAMMPWVHSACQACGGRMMRQDTLHMTLAFLGSTDADRVKALQQAVPAWSARVGTMILSRYGCFTKPRIVWAGPDQEASLTWLHELHDDLWTLPAQGFQTRP